MSCCHVCQQNGANIQAVCQIATALLGFEQNESFVCCMQCRIEHNASGFSELPIYKQLDRICQSVFLNRRKLLDGTARFPYRISQGLAQIVQLLVDRGIMLRDTTNSGEKIVSVLTNTTLETIIAASDIKKLLLNSSPLPKKQKTCGGALVHTTRQDYHNSATSAQFERMLFKAVCDAHKLCDSLKQLQPYTTKGLPALLAEYGHLTVLNECTALLTQMTTNSDNNEDDGAHLSQESTMSLPVSVAETHMPFSQLATKIEAEEAGSITKCDTKGAAGILYAIAINRPQCRALRNRRCLIKIGQIHSVNRTALKRRLGTHSTSMGGNTRLLYATRCDQIRRSAKLLRTLFAKRRLRLQNKKLALEHFCMTPREAMTAMYHVKQQLAKPWLSMATLPLPVSDHNTVIDRMPIKWAAWYPVREHISEFHTTYGKLRREVTARDMQILHAFRTSITHQQRGKLSFYFLCICFIHLSVYPGFPQEGWIPGLIRN